MKKLLLTLAALSMLATFVVPANAGQWVWVCSPDGNGGQSCHWECQGWGYGCR